MNDYRQVLDDSQIQHFAFKQPQFEGLIDPVILRQLAHQTALVGA